MGRKRSDCHIGCCCCRGLGVACVGEPLAQGFGFFDLVGVRPPPPPLTVVDALGGITLLFVLCGHLLFLLYVPHSGTIHWEPLLKVLTLWCLLNIHRRVGSIYI